MSELHPCDLGPITEYPADSEATKEAVRLRRYLALRYNQQEFWETAHQKHADLCARLAVGLYDYVDDMIVTMHMFPRSTPLAESYLSQMNAIRQMLAQVKTVYLKK